jgi:predicted Rossmann fold nucleotide-binding protein DprA/Smf involved in DNA uptake
MGRGIDAIGHQGAMDANGRAIAALGTGIDVCYPKENKKLYEKVLERSSANFRCARTPRRKIFRSEIASFLACHSGWWLRARSTAGR